VLNSVTVYAFKFSCKMVLLYAIKHSFRKVESGLKPFNISESIHVNCSTLHETKWTTEFVVHYVCSCMFSFSYYMLDNQMLKDLIWFLKIVVALGPV
jgi:hypothetical protein